MRETLTALAIVLIVLLTAALAAPYFVDWNAQRAFVEARLSHALGQKVTVGGAIDLKLLPTPYLVLDQAVVGSDDGPITMGIRHLRLELSVSPLLHGAFEVVDAQLDEPTIRVTLQKDRTLPVLPDAPAFNADVRFDSLSVVDGTLAIADPPSGRTLALEHLDFEAEVQSLAGPFKGSGAAGAPEARTKFRFASSVAQDGKARTKLVIDETLDHAGLDLDGMLMLAAVSPDSVRQTFEGTAAIFGHLMDKGDPLLPWRLSAPVHADPSRAAIGEGTFRLGSEDHNLTLSASGEAVFGEAPHLHLSLAGKDLDVDRLFGGGLAATGEATKPTLPDLAALRRALSAAVPPLPTTTDVTIDTAIYAGQTLSDLQASLALGVTGPQPVRFTGDGPGGTHLAVAGRLSPEAGVFFEGSAAVAASNAPKAVDWLVTIAPGLGLSQSDIPFADIEAEGRVRFAEAGFDASDLTVRLDRSSLTGMAHYTPASDQRPPLFKADVAAQALDFDALPDLGTLRSAATGTDLDIRLDARGIKVSRVGDAALDAGRIRFALARAGDRFALSGFRIEGLGGATIDAAATLDSRGGTLDAKLDAGSLGRVAALFRHAAPGALSEAVVARAAALAPAKLTLAATLKPGAAKGDWSPQTLTLAGTLGATTLYASLAPDPADGSKIVATGSAVAPEGGVLLRQIGFHTLALNPVGASRITVDATGAAISPAGGVNSLAGGAWATTIHAALGASAFEATGEMNLAAETRGGSGAVKLTSRDVTPLLQALAVAFPDLLGRIPVEAGGRFVWTPTGITLSDLSGRVAGTGTSGTLLWHADPAAVSTLTGSLHVDRLALSSLFGLSFGPAHATADRTSWSDAPFGTGLLDPPKALLDISAKALDFGTGPAGDWPCRPDLPCQDVAFTLGVAPGLIELKNLRAGLAGGAVSGDLSLRRDGATAAIEGKLAVTHLGLDLPSATGVLSGHIDLAGSGRTPLALVSSLAGTGAADVADLRIPRGDPAVLLKLFADVEADRVSIDEESIQRALDEDAHGPLQAGSRAFALSLAAGVLHADADKTAETGPPGPVTSSVAAAFDLRQASIDETITQTLRDLPQNWTGPPPEIVVSLEGPLRHPSRTADISAFINALATRALARESARIEAYEFDVHERAFFNQRLQSDRRREQDRVKADEDARLAVEAARKAEADRRAKDAALKLERARKAEEARAAQDRAQQERVQQQQDRAQQDRAGQENAARERAAQEQQGRDRAVEGNGGASFERRQPDPASDASRLNQPAFQSPGHPTDPSAAGRY